MRYIKFYYLFFLFLVLMNQSVRSSDRLNNITYLKDRYYVIESCSYNPGFFSLFLTVLGSLDFYEKFPIKGLTVKFNTGRYYDKEYNANWWENYFEPIELGSFYNSNYHRVSNSEKAKLAWHGLLGVSRIRGNTLINRYISVKEDIKESIDLFYKKNMKDYFIIGLHYRGTDKVLAEAKRVAYSRVFNAIDELISKNSLKKFRIFVATDEQAFLDKIKEYYKENVIYYDTYRSRNNQPIHVFSPLSPYYRGLDALKDCVTLSKCDILVRTLSNLSRVSAYFNCDIEEVILR